MDDNRELYHHGILGMRWGVRRGSNVSTGKNSKVGKKNLTPEPSEDHKITRRLSKKSTSELSNNELETLTKRLNLEKRYKDLKPNQVSNGKKVVDKIIKAGAVANSLYTLYKSPAATKARNIINNKITNANNEKLARNLAGFATK